MKSNSRELRLLLDYKVNESMLTANERESRYIKKREVAAWA